MDGIPLDGKGGWIVGQSSFPCRKILYFMDPTILEHYLELIIRFSDGPVVVVVVELSYNNNEIYLYQYDAALYFTHCEVSFIKKRNAANNDSSTLSQHCEPALKTIHHLLMTPV